MEEMEPTTTPEGSGGSVEDRLAALLSPEEVKKPKEEAVQEAKPEATDEPEKPEEADQPEEPEEEEEPSEDDTEELEFDAEAAAKALGIEKDKVLISDDGQLLIKTKVDGKIGHVSIGDLVKSYQTDSHVTQKSQALAEEKRGFDTYKQQGEAIVQQRVAEAAAVSQLLESQLTAEFNAINWDALRVQDPAEWTAKRQEIADRAGQLTQMKQRALSLVNQQMQEQQAKNDEVREARLMREAESLQAALPSWMEPEVAAKEQEAMSNFLVKAYGFAPGDVSGVEDHRLVLLALDAMKYRESMKAGDAAVKKVKALPKFMRPKAKQAAQAANAAHTQKTMSNLRKTGSVTDAAAALMARI